MRTVKSLIDELGKFPEDAFCTARGYIQLGRIDCCDADAVEDSPAVMGEASVL